MIPSRNGRFVTMIAVLLPLYSLAQEGLRTVNSFIIGDPDRPTNQLVEFGFNAVVGIGSIDKGCTITINPGAPVEIVFVRFSEEAPATFSVQGISDSGEYSPLSATMSANLPIFLWTLVYSAQCKCPPGNYVGITEMKRP